MPQQSDRAAQFNYANTLYTIHESHNKISLFVLLCV